MPYYPIEFELQENRVVMNNPVLSAEELERTALHREQRTRAEFSTPAAKMQPCVCDKYPCECSEF